MIAFIRKSNAFGAGAPKPKRGTSTSAEATAPDGSGKKPAPEEGQHAGSSEGKQGSEGKAMLPWRRSSRRVQQLVESVFGAGSPPQPLEW